MNFLQLSYNDHTLFHMLRHFEKLNMAAQTCLVQRGYKVDEIADNLSMPGSKFHVEFATDIKTLINQLEKGKIVEQQEQKKYLELVIEFETNIFPNGIGSLAICSLDQLGLLGASAPILKLNRGVKLWHATIDKIPTSNQLSLVVKKQANNFFLITTFPGFPALSIPHKKMNQEELALSKQFWSDKVFLEKRS